MCDLTTLRISKFEKNKLTEWSSAKLKYNLRIQNHKQKSLLQTNKKKLYSRFLEQELRLFMTRMVVF